jgi:hypothetical protein
VLEISHARVVDRLQLRRVHVGEVVGKPVGEHVRDIGADRFDGLGVLSKLGLLLVAVGRVAHRHDPLGRPLEQRQLRRGVDQRADDLNGARSGADDADALARQRHIVPPARAVKRRAPERIEAFDGGVSGVVEDTGRSDDEVPDVGRSIGHRDRPTPAVELAASDLLAVSNQHVDSIASGNVLEVRLDLRARRESVAPLRIQGEGVAVEMGGDVAGDAGVRVLPPRPTEAIGLLVDREVVEAGLPQLDRAEDSRHPGSDNEEARAGIGRIGECRMHIGGHVFSVQADLVSIRTGRERMVSSSTDT